VGDAPVPSFCGLSSRRMTRPPNSRYSGGGQGAGLSAQLLVPKPRPERRASLPPSRSHSFRVLKYGEILKSRGFGEARRYLLIVTRVFNPCERRKPKNNHGFQGVIQPGSSPAQLKKAEKPCHSQRVISHIHLHPKGEKRKGGVHGGCHLSASTFQLPSNRVVVGQSEFFTLSRGE